MNSEKLARTFVELADSLVDDFEPRDLLHVLVDRCVDLMGVSAAGLILDDGQGNPGLSACSAHSANFLGRYQLEHDEGPSAECLRTGQAVYADALEEEHERWPGFSRAATGEGFVRVLALPMRLRGRVIGALNLFDTESGSLLDPEVWPIAQAMADVSTIAILQERLGKEHAVLNQQLQTALNTRVLIEQAKGVLATRLNVPVDEAFELLRKRSRDDRRRIVEVAEEVVNARSDDSLTVDRHRS
jgi:GAF domain-containing protein